MELEITKLKQFMHEKGRRQLSLGRLVQNETDSKALREYKREQKLLTKEILVLKEDIARIESA